MKREMKWELVPGIPDRGLKPFIRGVCSDIVDDETAVQLAATPELVAACRVAYWAIQAHVGGEEGDVRQLLREALRKAGVEL